jgi:hypothetical protein
LWAAHREIIGLLPREVDRQVAEIIGVPQNTVKTGMFYAQADRRADEREGPGPGVRLTRRFVLVQHCRVPCRHSARSPPRRNVAFVRLAMIRIMLRRLPAKISS